MSAETDELKQADIERQKEILRNSITFESCKKEVGGQHCGLPDSEVTLKCDSLGLTISINYKRSMHANKVVLEKIFEFTLNELIT